MAFSEDIKKVFHKGSEEISGAEISLLGRSLVVISGHKGLSSLCENEVVVRLKGGRVRVVGENLRVEKVSPAEVYLCGKIAGVEFPASNEVSL